MLTNFERITQDITEKERAEILPLVVQLLRGKVGKERAVKNRQLVKWLRSQDVKVTEVKIRKIIHIIHIEGLVKRLMATSRGYFVTTDIEEYRRYVDSRGQRERNIHAATKACQEYLRDWEYNNVHQMELQLD